MINKGLQSLPGIALAAGGILLIYIGFRIVWKYAGNKEVPPAVRFAFGMIAGMMILLA